MGGNDQDAEIKGLRLIGDMDSVLKRLAEQKAKHGQMWGRWRFDAKLFQLICEDELYGIELEDCTDSAQVLDGLLQVQGKTWSTPEDIGNILKGIDAVAGGGLQGAVCPMGHNRQIDLRAIYEDRKRDNA